jgi:predicted secreted protein
MSTFVLTDAAITINAVDLSDWITSVSVSAEVDEQEDTAFGDSWRSRLGGLKDWTLDIEFNQDFAANAVDATVWPLLGTSTAVVIKPTSAAVGATNPSYSGNVLVTEFSPVDGSVGDLATTSVSWPGNGTLTRATA